MYNIDLRIWEILKEYEYKLSFDERENIAYKLDNLFEEVNKSTPVLDRLVTLETAAGYTTKALVKLNDRISAHGKEQDKLIEEQITHRGQISELTEQLKRLRGKYETLESRNTIIEAVLVNQATDIINTLTDNKIVSEYE